MVGEGGAGHFNLPLCGYVMFFASHRKRDISGTVTGKRDVREGWGWFGDPFLVGGGAIPPPPPLKHPFFEM